MIDVWFKNDLQGVYDQHSVAVFIDESSDAKFLLKTVEGEYTIYQANSELEELHVKYLVEKAQPTNDKFLIYTNTKRDNLMFVREYCETCGCLEIRSLPNYIKDKVHQTLNLNINLPKEELIAAAKVSVGKNQTYWMDISHKGATEIFDLEKELLPFVHDPKKFSTKHYDAQLLDIFYRKANELLGQEYLDKPAATLAEEIVKAMLDTLAYGYSNNTLESIYKSWLDSLTYRDSFKSYLDKYKIESGIDIWKVNIHHPFRQIDEKWLAEIGKNISDKPYISNTLSRLRQRHQSRQAQALGILFWNDVIALLEFDPKNITYLSSFSECVDFYKKYFCKLDTAIRHLYTAFLNKKELLEPFQELYKEHLSVFLDKWFKHWNEYQENQTGTLQRIIDNAGNIKIAVIVGDGITYEIAELVAAKIKGVMGSTYYKINKNSVLADIPSETENNMSRIYLANGVTEAVQENREKYLAGQNPDISIDFIRLDEVNDEALPGQFLICTYKDIDDIGHRLKQKALKYFAESIDFFAEKISLLLGSGYDKVYLITDHGFVLTGLLCEADKISVSLKGKFDKDERYIRTEIKQPDLVPTLIEVEKSYKEFRYIYFAKNINPFKSTGAYGFSHGGVSPQELVTPCFCWERTESSSSLLAVTIDNKADLVDVTGELFSVKIQSDKEANDLFSLERKVCLVFFANKTQVNKSDVFTIQQNQYITKDYTFDGYQELEVQLLDATTKQLLDKATIKQNNDRDLGGLA